MTECKPVYVIAGSEVLCKEQLSQLLLSLCSCQQ